MEDHLDPLWSLKSETTFICLSFGSSWSRGINVHGISHIVWQLEEWAIKREVIDQSTRFQVSMRYYCRDHSYTIQYANSLRLETEGKIKGTALSMEVLGILNTLDV